MFLFYVVSFFKKGETIQGRTLFKEIRQSKKTKLTQFDFNSILDLPGQTMPQKRRRSQTTMSFHFSIFSAMQSSDLKISSLEKKESSENGWFMKKVKELNKTQQLASHKSWNEILEAAAAQREPNIENCAVTELLVKEKKGLGDFHQVSD